MQIEKLKQLLKGPLPGETAHELMAPSVRFTGSRMPDPALARPSSVLILFYPRNGRWHLPFIQRPVYDGVHSGQISFPGGKCEEEDSDFCSTALRESHEEIGVDPGDVQILGALTPLYIPNSNFQVYPQVGWMDYEPDFAPDPTEVDEIIEVPLELLLKRENVKQLNRNINGTTLTAPYFEAGNRAIWGATAMILSEMLEVLRKI
ncbi:NUDIX hydrolase [Marinilabilia salmonicolor]|uniref:NUDIX hydrolase n=1 Tax=Marinilabilia salmonicolor TaxID=989 RepID=UPI00029A1B12|nr:CoA pyrophosphatase [Marinilabilia salmonicolor]